MTAIVYFGEMLVVSVFAIVLLVISALEIGSTAAAFGGGVVSWTLAETSSIHATTATDLPILLTNTGY
jgi:Na+/H+ antiporter NhaA